MVRGLLVSGLVLAANVAWACPGLGCGARTVPSGGSTIPQNAPAIGVQRAYFGSETSDGGTWVFPATTLQPTLRGDGGIVVTAGVPSDVGTFIAPPGWAVGSSWSLEFTDSTMGSGCVASSQFTIGPPAPLPTVAATITKLESAWESAQVNSCGGFPEAQLVRFRIQPSAEMQPWLALARWELEVDGRNANAAPFGTVPAGGYAPQLSPQSRAFRPLNIMQVECNPGPSGIGPGLHAVRFLARIEGVASPIASNTLMVQVACTPPDGGRPDSGLPDASFFPPDDAGSRPDASIIVPVIDGGSAASDAGAIVSDGGAAVLSGPLAGPGCSSGPAAVSSLALVALWCVRRRSRRG